ncbi:MAG TPA: Gfo/Idh/MocA family oxidoreductase [Ferruginibacter sp.]|nr:Gfo/Idh/MocA family oxidoreductase [Ferruginibacter sp.]HMP21507.1 Gfo/Idh/MocA family oxidoreductase [Ferruginibacter sp.]
MLAQINWGIIGCGDVTEVKSGPAFNKVPHSGLVAVMRRDAAKAADYARRHAVPKWYTNAAALINDAAVNAVYIATPPSSHAAYTLMALQAGKPVYVEKPMALNSTEAAAMTEAAHRAGVKLCVAHYRRALPYFEQVKQLIAQGAIGKPLLAEIQLHKKPVPTVTPAAAWRVDPLVAGGGLFHDLAPHQLDLMYHLFGPVKKATGVAVNQCGSYAADDMVAGTILFERGMLCNGTWCFNVPEAEEKDCCVITGAGGKIVFSFFEMKKIELYHNAEVQEFFPVTPMHVQQPMIEKVVAYFLNSGANPCPGEEGLEVMRLLENFTSHK